MPAISSPAVETAILLAVAYADVFDYPLAAPEVHRYLVGERASLATVQAVLDGGMPASSRLGCHDGYFFLAGREGVVEIRRRRSKVATEVWPRARRYGRALARLPFVRMVAVTGALAVDNVEPDTDIDYILVTEVGRLWLCRAMAVALVQWAARRGDTICPNYLLSERALTLETHNLFTAHELAQMVPLAGLEIYRKMCHLNGWATRFLPNAFRPAQEQISGPIPLPRKKPEDADLWRYPRLLAEALLRTDVGARLERWEMDRKVVKLSRQREAVRDPTALRQPVAPTEVAFSPDRCKGHFDRHGQRTLEAFAGRLQSLNIPYPTAVGPGGPAEGPAGKVVGG